ncbi:protein vein [Vespula maculifrons]|uniref:Protein vein n=1 Tax=Vespula maculifrons TaxID=7453 RepID=A0ABD2AZ95_VESMC
MTRSRRSKIVISSAKPEDSGRYECIAESTSGHRASLAAQLLVAHDTRIPETSGHTYVYLCAFELSPNHTWINSRMFVRSDEKRYELERYEC